MSVRNYVVPIVDTGPTLAYEARGGNGLKSSAILYVDDATAVFFAGGPNVSNTGANRGIPFSQASPLTVSGWLSDDYYVIAATGDGADLIVVAQGE